MYRDEVATIASTILKLGRSAVMEHDWVSSAGYKAISLSVGSIVISFIWRLPSPKVDATNKSA